MSVKPRRRKRKGKRHLLFSSRSSDTSSLNPSTFFLRLLINPIDEDVEGFKEVDFEARVDGEVGLRVFRSEDVILLTSE